MYLHSHQQCWRVPFSLHPRQLSLLLVFLTTVMLTGLSGISSWFDLYFPDDQSQWASSHVPVDHLYIFFGKEGPLPIFFNKGKFCILLEKNKCAQVLRFNKSNFHCFTVSETFLFLKQYVHGGEEYNDY